MKEFVKTMTFLLVLFVLALNLPAALGAKSPTLHPTEKIMLQRIATELKKTEWDFSVDPCSGTGKWKAPEPDADIGILNSVACDCSFNNSSLCRIVGIAVKGQNLSGELPSEFSNFLFLQQLDLSRNLFTGSIPQEWAKMRLKELSLMGNHLSGTFPTVLTKITTLRNLSIEGNRFYGPLPAQLRNLLHMEKFVLSANQFSGKLPQELAKMINMIDLRISSNNFSGRVPESLMKLKKLEKLHIQGCNLESPIPLGISQLTSLSDLRISDLRGNASAFPDLRQLKSLKTLILRNCSIYGSVPSFIGEMENLKNLDLSFNRLSGQIPSSLSELTKTNFIYLTGNMLTGNIPRWILTRNKNVDISLNNFTFGGAGPTQCLQGNINAVESYSSATNNIDTVQPCLTRNFPCSNKQYQYSMHINCGGKKMIINGTTYEADREERGASMLYLGSNWAFSSTGNFLDDDIDADSYIATSTSKLSMLNPELYVNARLSPLSLTYYGLCMGNGNYTVKLHFAETIFTNDSTFSSLGKRIFNVFIQGKMALEDFNIEDEAGGPGRPIIKNFTATINDNTLRIQLYWAGKGTTGIPERGVYGPLISAISVTPDFEPPNKNASARHRRRTIIIAAVSTFVVSLVLVALISQRIRRRKRDAMYKELRGLDLQTGSFTLRQIKAATKNFHAENKLGEGGFGSVFKGLLSDGTIIAVKQLSSRSRQGNREFVNEIGMISALQHPNLVRLYGCCMEGNQLLLIYEYMDNNSLARALFSSDEKYKLRLKWQTRYKICLGIARGLTYLHEGSTLKIVHRDIKGSNILLDKDLNAKISDFGLAKLSEEDHSHISTRIAGTVGYMAPEYAMRGYLTEKADVYSFGVVALEIVTGKSNTNYRPKEEFVYLLDWACVLHERGTLLELVDPELGSDFSKEEALLLLNVALLCTNSAPTLRPTMSKVVGLLEGRASLQPLLSNLSNASTNSNGFMRTFWQVPSEGPTVSFSASYIESSGSAQENDPDKNGNLLLSHDMNEHPLVTSGDLSHSHPLVSSVNPSL